MKFLSDILAKAGLTVDGVVTLNNTATGQTPSANDNSTKLATTAWVRTFVQPYNLPIASGTTLGGVKIGSGLTIDGTGIVSVAASGVGAIRALQQITATAGQTVFTVSGGYTPGLIDVFLNGVLLTPTAIDATNGNSFTLADAAVLNDLLDVFVYNPIYNGFISSTDQVPEGIVNLYYTNTRARSAISLTVTGTSGASTYDSGTGVLNVPTYSLSGLGGVPTSRTITIDGVTFDLTANRTWTILPTGGAAGDILAKTSATNYAVAWIPNYTSQVQHYVKLGEAMTIGTAVYVSGTTGNAGTNMIVSKASNASEPTSSKTIGLLASSGAQNDIVFVVTEGLVSGIDTSTATAGDPVWLGVNGQLIYGLLNKPNAPQHLVFIGVVTRVQQVNGEIFVKVQNGFELHELHNVSALNPADGDMIKYVASTGLWTKIAATTNNITEGTNLYYTDGRVSTYLTANGYATQTYVNTAVSNLVASAPSTLDTLNELAAALGNDPSFATTVATSIGGKLSLTGGTLTGILNLNNATSNRINFGTNGVATPTFTTYSNGVKIILYDSLGASALGYTIGIDAGTLFNTLPAADAGMFFKWYGGTTVAASLGGTGIFTAASLVKSGGIASEILAADGSVITAGSGILISGGLISSTALGGVTSFNTRTGAITLSSTDVTTALTYTPVTNARTLTINGTAYDLTADRSWTVGVNPSARAIETFTATASQTTFTVTGGYVVGLVDVFINGVRLTSVDYTATNGTTIVLSTGTGVGNIVDIVKYTSAFIANNALRQTTYFTATAGQTTFTISYTPGLVDVFYNGSKLASTEYTALNGTSIVLSTAASLNDVIEVTAYTYSVGAYSGQAQLNGTGFVKISGSTISYDNSTYLTTSVASSTYLPLTGGTLAFSPASTTANVLTIKNTVATGNDFVSSVLALDTTAIGAVADIRLGSTNPLGIRIYASNAPLTVTPTGAGFQMFTNASPSLPGHMYFDSGAHNSAALNFRTAVTGGNITTRLRIEANGTIKLSMLTSNGFVKTGSSDGSLSIDTNTYLTTSSASSTYLPLAGGTLSGPLTGTTSIWNGYAINATPPSVGTAQTFVRYISAGSDWYIGSEGSVAGNFFGGASAYASVFFGTNPFQFITAGVKRFEIATGGITSTVGFTGTSATFTSQVVVASPFTIKDTNPYIQWKNSSDTRLGYIQHATNLVMSADTGSVILTTASGTLTLTSVGNFDYGGYNIQSSNNAIYRQAFWGAMSIMWRNAEDFYIDSNHTYSSSNTNVASYTSSNGIGRIGIAGGDFSWSTYNGAVNAGSAYGLTERFNIAPSGVARFSSSVQATDFRYTNTGYITYDTANTGSESLIIRKFGTPVLTLDSISRATFASTVFIGGNLHFDTNGTVRTISNYGYGGSLQLLRSDSTSTRWARIGMVDATGTNFIGGMTINNDTSATFSSNITTTGTIIINSRTVYTTAAIYDNASAGNNVGIGFGPNSILPITGDGTASNGTKDLGSSSVRWSTVYTSDLSLSNGIGDYTIVEGENDLFLYNNKQNKVYKFMLAEVDPAYATPKKS